MDKNIETMLIECHILMSDALKGYEDRAYISNKLFEIRQYRNKLPEDVYGKIKKFADKNIRPMAYDAISGLSQKRMKAMVRTTKRIILLLTLTVRLKTLSLESTTMSMNYFQS